MDYIHDFDNKLATIKAFHTFLSEIIDKGYLNDIKTISNIVDSIEMFYKTETFDDNNDINSLILTDNNIKTESESESDIDNTKHVIYNDDEKVQQFMENYNDISSILLYNKKPKYINRMRRFINSSKEY